MNTTVIVTVGKFVAYGICILMALHHCPFWATAIAIVIVVHNDFVFIWKKEKEHHGRADPY